MTDNIALDSGSGGDTLAADDISSVKHQRVKIEHGADGSATDVSTASPLPVELDSQALTAILHAITATINSSGMSDGLTALTPKFAIISTAVSQTNTLVAAVAGKKIRVLAYAITAETAAGTFRFEDGAAGSALTGVMTIADNAAVVVPFNPVGWFETSAATLLNLETVGVAAMGHLVYVEVA